ncbi:hypothetical protein AZE42_04455 [Rhizopogon vesiculosus]|uniref:Mid2 domain-containing protein n=1 Tax=Rhizopogon vesiculosus TaxID=180088 RepID=A0A1J8Q3F2_9AGAM|nr:hypothetical protein AZE42_04455 [Rhizopogon vesiculosus]
MSRSPLPAMAFVLALHSSAVGASILYMRESELMLARDGGDGGDDNGDDGNGDGNGNGNGKSSTTSSRTTTTKSSTTTSTSSTTTSTSSTITSTSSTTTSTTSTSSDGGHDTSTTYTSNTQSISSFTTTATLTSSSSGSTSSAQNNQDSSTSTASQGLSTAARTGLSFGIMFFLILSAILFCYLKRRSRRARENASYQTAPLSSEVGQYRPPGVVALRERELPPPPRLDITHPNSSDISHSPPPSANSSVTPFLSDGSPPNSQSISAWNRNSTLSQVTSISQISMQEASALPNPHDPFSAPARSASNASTMVSMASSPPHSRPYDTSALGSAAMTSAFAVPGASNSSDSQPQRRLSALHTDLARHQKELELDHRKSGLDAQEEPQDPPPEYSS